jgi:hypothetical protein
MRKLMLKLSWLQNQQHVRIRRLLEQSLVDVAQETAIRCRMSGPTRGSTIPRPAAPVVDPRRSFSESSFGLRYSQTGPAYRLQRDR